MQSKNQIDLLNSFLPFFTDYRISSKIFSQWSAKLWKHLIFSLFQVYWGPIKLIDISIIDDIFFELQLYEKFKDQTSYTWKKSLL